MDLLSQKPKALLVDMDGTLVDTIPMLYEAYMSFLKNYGILGTPKEFQTLMGPSLSEIIDYLQQRYKLTEERSTLLNVYQQGLIEAYEQKVNFFPEALETMSYAKKKHIKLALVSSSENHFIKAFIKGAGLAPLFDVVISCQDGARSKPYPDLYLKALERLKYDSKEVVAIEDSLSGVQAATSAGVYTFWIKHNTFFEANSLTPEPISSTSVKLYHQIDDWKSIMEKLKEICGE